MRTVLNLAIGLLMSLPLLGQQQYIVDPAFSDLGNRLYKRVIGIVYEPELDTYMVAGTFSGGSPYTPCINRVTDNGETHFSWNPNFLNTCDGVIDNFFPTPIGYRFNDNMVQVTFEATADQLNILDFSGTQEQTVSSPRGWADDDGYVYVGSNWIMTEEEGQPETGLLRFDPEGNRDTEFPYLKCGHPFVSSGGYISDIYEYDDDRLLLGGAFDSINGYLTPRLARIFKDGTLDTSFSSGLERRYQANIIDVDPQGRILVHHLSGGSEDTPNDTLEVWRLLPDGSLDPTWNLIDLAIEPNTYGGTARTSLRFDDGSYLIYGTFEYVNGEPRSSICIVDSTGILMDTFSDSPFIKDEESQPQLAWSSDYPRILDAVFTPDGGIMLGGVFTHYQGEAHLNLIKLILDTGVNTTNRDFPVKTKVFPNPATDQITLELSNPENLTISSVQVVDLSGRIVKAYTWQNGVLDVSGLSSGMYLLQVTGSDGGVLGAERMVVE